ncbi:ribosome biogenesis GTPase YqeH [Bacillaceae bacterium Marseille-Q3522]|nr:ribosome biogenesis GTPase YqeH [Bacillaceae bacterium Marseille-Q3522]
MGGIGLNQQLYCIGCGAAIQSERPDEIGYVPPSALEKEEIICRRCFRLKHYHEIENVSLTDDDFLQILSEIANEDALIVKIVDIFDFNGSWLPGIHRFVGKNNILLIGNKIDLLPKSVKRNKLIQWMRHEVKLLGLKAENVYLISAEKGLFIREAAEAIEHYRNGKKVYVVGCTNVGKSTFINRLIKEVSGEGDVITTSPFPGTTLNKIEIPLADGEAIIDTPGIINHHQMAHYVDKQDLKMITPKKEMKPKIYQLQEKQTLFFGGLARFDYLSGGKRSFVCYFANELPIHRTKTEQAPDLYARHLGEMLTPPRKASMNEFPPLVRNEFFIKEEKIDVVISGLGWITINQPGAKIAVYVPKGVHAIVRKSLI